VNHPSAGGNGGRRESEFGSDDRVAPEAPNIYVWMGQMEVSERLRVHDCPSSKRWRTLNASQPM
jgi:hypothetical protein